MRILAGVRVLELGGFITGPYAGMMLAEFGADVVKIEKPGIGDPFRKTVDAIPSAEFRAYNWHKRSVTLDYATPAGRDILRLLCEQADVLILNARPGVAQALKIDFDTVHLWNSRLIYCEISGFGPTGPYARRPAFDTVGQALSGWLSLFQDDEDPRIAGPAACDMVTGMFAANGVLAALYEREASGVGRHVELSMLGAMMAFNGEALGRFLTDGETSERFTRGAFSQAFVFTCRDGLRLAIHMSSPEKFWRGLLEAISRPELGEDPRFNDRTRRNFAYEALGRELKQTFLLRDRDAWIELLERHDVPFAPVYAVDEVASDPHVAAQDSVARLPHPKLGSVAGVRRPVYFDGDRSIDHRGPPALGQDTAEILRRIGLSQGDIDGLRSQGVV